MKNIIDELQRAREGYLVKAGRLQTSAMQARLYGIAKGLEQAIDVLEASKENKVAEAVMQAKLKAQKDDISWEKQRRESDREWEESQRIAGEWRKYMLPGTVKQYSRWLKAWIEKGGEITHVYDYKMPEFLYATRDFKITPMHGSGSIDVMCAPGVKVDMSEGAGHATVWLWNPDGDPVKFGSSAHLYSNIVL